MSPTTEAGSADRGTGKLAKSKTAAVPRAIAWKSQREATLLIVSFRIEFVNRIKFRLGASELQTILFDSGLHHTRRTIPGRKFQYLIECLIGTFEIGLTV